MKSNLLEKVPEAIRHHLTTVGHRNLLWFRCYVGTYAIRPTDDQFCWVPRLGRHGSHCPYVEIARLHPDSVVWGRTVAEDVEARIKNRIAYDRLLMYLHTLRDEPLGVSIKHAEYIESRLRAPAQFNPY